MRQPLEWSGMWTIAIGVMMAGAGLIVLITTRGSWALYAAAYVVIGIGAVLLFASALRDRLRARKTEDLDDVGFN